MLGRALAVLEEGKKKENKAGKKEKMTPHN